MTTTIKRPEAPTRCTVTARFTPDPNLRSDDGLRIRGYAAVFESESEDLGFIETLQPGCFARALAREGADPYLYWSHDRSVPLARESTGSLKLREDQRGLFIEADLAPTTAGKDAAILVRRGDVSSMSFGFTVSRDRWSEKAGQPHRRVLEVGQLMEVSLVSEPAYKQTSVEPDDAVREARARVARAARRHPRVIPRPDVYRPDGEHSWFADLVQVATAEARARAAAERGLGRVWSAEALESAGETTTRGRGTVAEARARLASVQRRDVTTSDPGAVALGANVPAHVAEAFALAAGHSAVLASALTSRPLPEMGMTVRVPRLETAPTVAAQSAENAAVVESDPDTGVVDAPVRTLAGLVDVSLAALERGLPDDWLARALGDALGRELDRQLVNGSGAAGELTGLIGQSGITTLTLDDPTPSPVEVLAGLGRAVGDLSVSFGRPPAQALMALHPRRRLWVESKLGYAPTPWPCRVIDVPAMPTTAGAGTEDRALVWVSDMVTAFLGPVLVEVFPEVLSGAGTVRVRARTSAALAVVQPAAVTRVVGTSLAAPIW